MLLKQWIECDLPISTINRYHSIHCVVWPVQSRAPCIHFREIPECILVGVLYQDISYTRPTEMSTSMSRLRKVQLTKEYCQSKLHAVLQPVARLDEARAEGFRKTLGHMQFATVDSFSISGARSHMTYTHSCIHNA